MMFVCLFVVVYTMECDVCQLPECDAVISFSI